jgi:hypothetical protein
MATWNDLRDHSTPPRSSLPVIKCTCGSEILLVPDIKAMAEALENHVAQHQRKYGLSAEEADGIREHLIVQIFELASKAETK